MLATIITAHDRKIITHEVDELKLVVNSGDQEFLIYEQNGTLVVKKIESGQPNSKAREPMTIYPGFENLLQLL